MRKKKAVEKRLTERKIDLNELPLAYNMRTEMCEQRKFVHTLHGPKIVSGYVSIEEFNKLSCPILTKFPYFVYILKEFEQGMKTDSAPLSQLVDFLRQQISINEEVHNLQEFVDKPKQLADAISETDFLETSELGQIQAMNYEIRKRKC